MVKAWLGLILVGSAVLLSGCGATDEGFGCAAVALPAIEVTVVDAQTGAYAAKGAVGTVQDGSFTAPLQVIGWLGPPVPGGAQIPTTLGGPYERAGTYTVRVEKPGYATWERSSVRVTKGPCNVNTVRLQADLQPLP
jgi:hypothetical protein